jgi:hypothetical protein
MRGLDAARAGALAATRKRLDESSLSHNNIADDLKIRIDTSEALKLPPVSFDSAWMRSQKRPKQELLSSKMSRDAVQEVKRLGSHLAAMQTELNYYKR